MKKTKKLVSFLAILLIAIVTLSCCFFFACGSDDGEDDTKATGTFVTINPETITFNKEKTTDTITATVTMSDGTDYDGTYAWASDNEDVATVSGTGASATVTAVAVGTANITVTAGEMTATCAVTVTYADMTDNDAANLYAAIAKTCEYEGSFTAVNTWIWSDIEEYIDEGEPGKDSEVDTETTTYSYDSESGYLVYKYEDVDIESSDDEEGNEEREFEYTYYVPGEDGTLTAYTWSGDDDDEEGTKEKSTLSNEDNEYIAYTYYSSIAWLTDLDYTMDNWDESDATVEGLREYVYRYEMGYYFDEDEDEDEDAEAGDWDIHVETSGGNTIYSINYTLFELQEDEDGDWSGEYTYTFGIEYCVNEEGYVSRIAIVETETDDRIYVDDEDDEGEYDNETYMDSYVWEISYSFDESLKLSEEEMEQWVEEDD